MFLFIYIDGIVTLEWKKMYLSFRRNNKVLGWKIKK